MSDAASDAADGAIALAQAEANRGGIQSLDTALVLLRALAQLRRPASLTELARLCDLAPSTVHRYLASFLKADIILQRQRSGRYELGKGALELGLAAMAGLDLVNRAADRLGELVDATGAAALLAIWGNQGPTVVRWERAASFVITSVGLGTTLPLLNSATGRVFLAFGPPRVVWTLADEEIERAAALGLTWPDLTPDKANATALARQVRADGYAAVDGRFIPGLKAISAPVLNWQGEAELVLTIVTGDPSLLQPDGKALAILLETCRALSIDAAAREA